MEVIEYKIFSRCFGLSSDVGFKTFIEILDKYFVNRGWKRFLFYLFVLIGYPIYKAVSKYRASEFVKRVPELGAKCFVYWFHPNSKKSRVYMIRFDTSPHRFIKVTFDSDNTQLIENEARALVRFSEARSFSVPRLVDFKELSMGGGVLQTELLGGDVERLVKQGNNIPKAIFDEISHSLQDSLISSGFEEREKVRLSGIEFLREDYVSELVSDYKVAPAHGDLGSQNLLSTSASIYLIDWERYTTSAPVYSDFIGYMLGLFHIDIRSRRLTFGDFHQHCLSHIDISIDQVSVCLLFYCSIDFDLAKNLLESHPEAKHA